MASIYKRVGERVKRLRKNIGYSQEELAEKATLDYTSVQNIESGSRNPSLKTLSKIARALKVSVRDLFE